ncbi:S-layer homology domain-containing protein [Intestinibacillus sp. Marseille-P6563]|uniref:S-layer homology domain-containing protein n=1 Tax=Intestinibacillus sp. Marseille-P6563 TaxID=2364792 RepID=UPI000F057005|nr:S-layer homology domain-containing protein [Intestinibacillus sp. Marseille-P6563]
MAHVKKVLALVLAFAMAFTMMATAGAAYTDQADIEATEAVEMLNAIGVMTGDPDGSFRPNDTITRAEACRMIYTIRTNSDNADAYKNMQTTFKDVPSDAWYAGYVKHCQAAGIVSGTSATTFEPNRDVTGVELALMCLRVMGYDPAKADIGGSTWSTKTIGLATEAGILEDVNTTITDACPRQWAAQIMYNTIDARTVRWSNDSETYTDLDMGGNPLDRVGKKYMKLYVNIGTLTTVSKQDLTISMSKSDEADSDDSTIKSFTKLGQNYSSLLGQKVKVLYRDNKPNDVIGVYATEENQTYETVMNAVSEDAGKVKFDSKTYSVENTGIAVYVDGVRIAPSSSDQTGNFKATDFADTASLLNGSRVKYGTADTIARTIANNVSADEVKFVDSDDNSKIDTAIVTTVEVKKASYVSSDEIVAGGETYKYEDHNISEDVKKNDYVVIRANLFDDCKDITPAQKLSGVKVTGTKESPTKYLIDGTWYVEGVGAEMNSVKSGDTVDAYVVNGAVFYAKRSSGENATLSDVAIVLSIGTDIQGDKVKILKLDSNTTEIVDIDNDPGSDYVAKDKLVAGAVYEYSVKSSKYRFKTLDKTADYFGDYTSLNDGAPATVTASDGLLVEGAAGADKTIGGVTVADSAKVVLIDNYKKAVPTKDVDYKIINGKQFKSLTVGSSTDNVYTNGGIAAFTSKVDGVKRVTYAVVGVNGIADNFVTNDNYGYVVEDSYKSDNGYVVYTIWNGTENVKVQEKGSTTRQKGKVLGYSKVTTEEGLADGVVGTIEDVDDSFGLQDGTVYGVNDAQTKISLDGKNQNEITSDTVVLYVDTKDHKGYANGEIQEADEFNDVKITNVMYKLDGTTADADVSVLIVDVKNNLRGEFKYNFGAGSTADDINKALTKGDVTINGALDAMTLDVPKGNTLSITATQTSALTINVEDGAKLQISADAAVAENSTLTAKPGASVVVAGTREMVGPNSLSSAGNISLKVLADNKMEYTLTADAVVAGNMEIAGGDLLKGAFNVTGKDGAKITVYKSATLTTNEWKLNVNSEGVTQVVANNSYIWGGSDWTKASL